MPPKGSSYSYQTGALVAHQHWSRQDHLLGRLAATARVGLSHAIRLDSGSALTGQRQVGEHACSHTHMHACTHTYVYIHTCTHTYTHARTTHTYTNTPCMHTHHAHIHTHTMHTYTQTPCVCTHHACAHTHTMCAHTHTAWDMSPSCLLHF